MQHLQVEQQETLVSSVELEPPVAQSLPKVESKTVPDVDEGFVMVSHPQTPLATIPVDSFSAQERPFPVQATAESVSITEGTRPLSVEEPSLCEENKVTFGSPVVSQHESAAEDTIVSDASPIPDEEVPIQSQVAIEFELKQEPILEVGSQTGNSLLDQLNKEIVESIIPEVTTKDVETICHPPVDMEVQTEVYSQSVSEPVAAKKEVPAEVAVQTARDTWTSPAIEMQRNKIYVLQKVTGDEETIEIATKAGVGGGESLVDPAEESITIPEEKHGDTGDDLLVEVKFKGKNQDDAQSMSSTSELNIVHTTPQSFETVLIDPGESTTEVIVDKDGNQKIIVRKVRHTVISQQQQQQHTVQQTFQTFTTSDIGSEGAEIPVTQSIAFSQVILQGQQSTVSENQGDGKLHVTTTKSYTGKVSAGVPGGDLTSLEFSTEPQHQTVTYHTVSEETEARPASAVLLKELEAQEISSDGYTIVEPSQDIVSAEREPEHVVISQPEDQDASGDQLITTSAASVHAVVQQVTRRVIRRIRRIVRRVVVIDGKEHVTEEVVEEPEEVEVTEEEVPRVRVEISRTEDGDRGPKISDYHQQEGYQLCSPGDTPVQVEPGFVSGILHTLPLQEGGNTYNNVVLNLQGKPTTGIQDVHMEEKHEPSPVQEELVQVSMICQTPVEKQENIQTELEMSAPGSLQEEKEVMTKKGEVERVFLDTPDEVIMPETLDTKMVVAATAELKDQINNMLPDTSESAHVKDTQVMEEDKDNLFHETVEYVPETGVEYTSPKEFRDHLPFPEFNKDSTVIAAEELAAGKEMFEDVTSNISEQEELHIVRGTEEILPNTSSVFDSFTLKLVEIKPKTESESIKSNHITKGDYDVKQSVKVKEESSVTQLEKPESPPVTHYEARVTGVETVTDIPVTPSSDMSPALESCILPELKEELGSLKAVTELQDQCIPVQIPEVQKVSELQPHDTVTGENLVIETTRICELPEGDGTIDKFTSEETVEPHSTERPHTAIEDTAITVSLSEPSRITDVRTSEVPECEDITPGVVVESLTGFPKPNEFQEIIMKPDEGVSQNVMSQTSPEQGVKTIEFALSIEEKSKPSLQKASEIFPKVSSTIKTEEKELKASTEGAVDELTSVTVPEHVVVKEDVAIQLPGTKTVLCTEEMITSVRPVPVSLKTEVDPRDGTSSDSETEITASKRSRRRKKHEDRGAIESSPEGSVQAEQVKAPEQTPEDISHDIKVDKHEDQISVETSLAESTEIIIPGSSASSSSDTTKPTEAEIVMFEIPISPLSPRDSERTHDTGYEPEDKTTLDEMSIVEEDNKQKSKRKKKKKQKIKVKEHEESSSVIPKSSVESISDQVVDVSEVSSIEKHNVESSADTEVHSPEPDEASMAASESTTEKVITGKRGSEKKGKKRKKDRKEPEAASEFREPDVALNMQIADSQSPELFEESYRELKSEKLDGVQIMEEAVPTQPPREAVDALVDSQPKSVEIWELLHLQEQSAQTVTPDMSKSTDTVMVESSVQTREEQMADTQEGGAQTVTPVPVVEKIETTDFTVQTLKEELTLTQEESAQTKTPEVVELDPILTIDTFIQTEMESVLTHEEAAQTVTPEPMQLVDVDTVDSSIQTKTEEITPMLEDSVQTLTPEVPVTHMTDTFIQTVKDELTPMHEGSVQTVTPEPAEIPEPLKVETCEFSIQTSKEEINPVREEYAQTVTPERLVETVEMSSQPVKVDPLQTQEDSAQTVSPEFTEITQVDTSEMPVQTIKEEIMPTTDEYSQTVSPEVPQVEKVEIAEISTQTTRAIVPSTQEEYAQTLSLEVPDVTETFIHMPREEIIPTEEESSQTVTTKKSQEHKTEMADSSTETKKEEIIPSKEFSQTVPPVVSEPEENTFLSGLLEPEVIESIDTGQSGGEDITPLQDLPQTTVSSVSHIPVDAKVETAETSIQTKPVFVKEYGDERSQSSSSEEPFEIHIQTSVSFTSSVESGDIWRASYDTNTGAFEDRKPRTQGDVSAVCEIEKGGNICTTAEMPLTSEGVKSAQVISNILYMPGVEVEPVTDLAIKTEENVEPSISVTDLCQTEPKRDTKDTMYDFLSSEIGAELKDEESRQHEVKLFQDKIVSAPDLGSTGERVTTVTELEYTELEQEKHLSSKDRKSKHKRKSKKTQGFETSSVPELVSSECQEQTESPESTSESTYLEEAQLTTEVSYVEDVSRLKPEILEAKFTFGKDTARTEDTVVIPTDPEIKTEEKVQHSELSAGKKTKKSKKSSKVQKIPADTKLMTDAEFPLETQALKYTSDEDILDEFKPSYSAVAKLSSKPGDNMEAVFLTEERKVSGQPVRGEHSPGPPVIQEVRKVTTSLSDPSSGKEMKPTARESDAASTTEQFLIHSRDHAVDTEVESDATYVKEKPTEGSDITEKLQNVIPIATSEESELILQEPPSETQVTQPWDSEDEIELSKCKDLVIAEDISVHLEPRQPPDAISIPAEESTTVKWKNANNVLSERVKNLQNARKTTHVSGVLYLATLEEVLTEEPIEQKSVHVEHNLSLLRSAVEKKDVVVIQRTVITTVETISTWLETIEYRVYLNRQKTNTAPTQEQMREFGTLKAEISNIEESVDALEGVLETASGICNEDDKIHMKECLASLQEHVKAVEEIAQEGEEKVAKDLICWEEFLNGVNNISVMVEELKQQLEELVQSDISAQLKLQELEKIETVNHCHMLKTSCLLKTARNLVRDFPGREIPPETYTAHETTRIIEHSVALERERLLQLLSLADDYEQTLKEFSQIIDVADTLVDSPISVISLEHLQEEMQKHRKFFVNLSHCRGILESLEGNLDPETRALHSQLHQTLHCRATAILDKAASRAQQMALAASRWTVLEQGMKDERGWLQVAHQRVPDLQTVNSSDYDQYISLYQVSVIIIVKTNY